MKRVLKWIGVILLVLVILISVISINFFMHLKKYEADNGSFYASYYVYESSKVKRQLDKGEEVELLVLPNNTGGTSDDVKKHEKMALLQMFIGHIVFKDVEAVIMVPTFTRPSSDSLVYTHALDRDTLTTDNKILLRPDLQLNAMIMDLRNRDYALEDKILLWGHSASGMFVNRYTVLHPEKVKKVAIIAPGGWPVAPIESYEDQTLRYPIGVSDLEELVGYPFNEEAYSKVPHLLLLGSGDTNDSVPYSDSYEDEDRVIINGIFGETPIERWPIAEEIYKSVLNNVTFNTYDGTHAPSLKALKDCVEFLKKAE